MNDKQNESRLNIFTSKHLPTYENGVRRYRNFAQKCASVQYQSQLKALTVICCITVFLLTMNIFTTKPWYRDIPITGESDLNRYFNRGYTHAIMQVDTLEQIGTLTYSSTNRTYLLGSGMDLFEIQFGTTETTYHTYLYTLGDLSGFYIGPDGMDESSLLRLQQATKGNATGQLVQKWNRTSDAGWIYNKLLNDLVKKTGEPTDHLEDRLLPGIVAYSASLYLKRIQTTVVLAVLLIFGILLRGFAFRHLFMRKHTAFGEQLSKYGPIHEMECKLNDESLEPIYVDSSIMLTRSFLVQYNFDGLSRYLCQVRQVDEIENSGYYIDHIFDDGDARYRLWFVADTMETSTTTMDENAARKAVEHIELYSPLSRMDHEIADHYFDYNIPYDRPI